MNGVDKKKLDYIISKNYSRCYLVNNIAEWVLLDVDEFEAITGHNKLIKDRDYRTVHMSEFIDAYDIGRLDKDKPEQFIDEQILVARVHRARLLSRMTTALGEIREDRKEKIDPK